MKQRIIILLLAFLSSFILGWGLCDLAFGEKIFLDDGTSKKQTIKIKDLTGKTKRIKYRIYGVNRNRIKIYTEDGKIKRYKIRKY